MNIEKLIKEAEKLQKQSRFTSALSLYKKIDKMDLNHLDEEEIFYLRLNEGHCARLAGDFKSAIKYYSEALRLGRKIDEIATADSITGLAITLRAMGKLSESFKKLNIASSIYEKYRDKEGLAYVTWARGASARYEGKLNEAYQLYKTSLTLYKKLGDKTGIGYSLCGLGGVTRVMGEFEKSLRFYTSANETFHQISDRFGIAYSYCGIANANRMLGNFELAKKYFKLATKNYEKIGDKISYAYTLWGEGTLAKVIGDNETAMQKFSKAEEIFKETNDKRGLIYTELGKIEIKFIESGKIERRKINSIISIAERHMFRIELLHAELFKTLAEGGSLSEILNKYKKLGTKFFKRIKLNIPLNLP